MRFLKFLSLAVALVLVLSGCYVQSLSPFYTEQDLLKDDSLIGTWMFKDNGSDQPEQWIFESNEDGSLTLRITKEEVTDSVVIHTFELNGVKLMDLYPDGNGMDPKTHFIAAFQWVPVHLLAKYEVDPEEGKLRLYPLSVEWFKDMALNRKLDIEYTVYQKSQVLLVADSEQIQEFLAQYLDVAFAENYGRLEFEKQQ